MQRSEKTHVYDADGQLGYETLMRRMLFACERCNGALVQAAMCRFCRLTTLRNCTDCSLEVSAPHMRCVPKKPMLA